MNLIVQPDAGIAPVVHAINKAKQRVDLAIFRSDRKEIVKALAAAVQRGAHVRVLVAHTNHGGENKSGLERCPALALSYGNSDPMLMLRRQKNGFRLAP